MSSPLETFLALTRRWTRDPPRVLELGTRRSNPEVSTMHKDWLPNAAEWVGSDFQAGLDVDVVADVHKLSSVVGRESFDIVITASGFEHFKYPFLAAHEIMRTLKLGGALFVQTHQTFPIHAYPFDYWRFTTESLSALFPPEMGMKTLDVGYEFPAKIHSERDPNTERCRAFLNVCIASVKMHATPETFVYNFDGDTL